MFLGVFYFGAQFYIPSIYFDVCCEPQMLVRALWSLYTDTVLEATKYMSKSILSYSKYILYLKSTAYILGVYICETICRTIHSAIFVFDLLFFIQKKICPGVFSQCVYREFFIMEMFLYSREFSGVLNILFSFHNWGQRRWVLFRFGNLSFSPTSWIQHKLNCIRLLSSTCLCICLFSHELDPAQTKLY